MLKDLLQSSQLDVVKFLYQFKNDNKYYRVDKNILKTNSYEESNFLIYILRENALIATDREIYCTPGESGKECEEIKAKILPKGIFAVETILNVN